MLLVFLVKARVVHGGFIDLADFDSTLINVDSKNTFQRPRENIYPENE